ncbi:hypothetical protein EDC17_103231 [Sphingobacterium alimentarium]|uniref:Acyltransferase-like protein n=1 Tax=Sphingobacterium alimentarium TaxID=797292 RepID=A0A4R3VX19_9SPHI|nr:hypothetical protein EDC17_103231 [Sphingobacterium alimentarium]
MTYWPNFYGLFSTFLLLGTTISIAYTNVPQKKFFNGNDLSYGMYLFHMPIVNLAMYLGFYDNYWVLVVVFVFTFFISFLSWKFIEKPALNLK